MKVLQINTVSGYGSTGRIVVDLTKEMVKQGNEAFISYGQKDSKYKNSFRIGTFLENKCHNILSRIFDRQGFYTSRGTNKLIKYINEINPDIVHLHNLHGNYININILFKFLSQSEIPVIWTLHDCWPFTGHCAYFDYVDCNKWIKGCYECPLSKSYPPSIILDNSKSNYNIKKKIFNGLSNMTIVTPSEWLAGLVKQSFLSKYDVTVINNGIDTNTFDIKDVNALKIKLRLENKIVLLGVSAEGFESRKGLKYFIELAKSLTSSYQLILIGATKNDCKQLPNNVIAISRTNNAKQLAEYYSLADIFLNPTLEDNFPTTNLEALACGTPVITFNTGGSPEVVDETTGIVVDKMDSKGLLNAILLMNRQFKKTNSLNCRKKAVEYYDKKRMYKKYLELYHLKTEVKC
ncbi:glycosyltransferase [Chryseobacterium salivictor]|uniref:Alpha-maltose-1-phosphate synthase n=1 Tax=Chryseobacterium salivictor TaxID=2547600 RepID=A0A4P6ZJT5_9FLAO|nr:glycosyltransferase [Chryseobacterium salivictor]QBO59675.1 Alpha-maltose-1-phosphate synthase [Chryseobacterium salivictor]